LRAWVARGRWPAPFRLSTRRVVFDRAALIEHVRGMKAAGVAPGSGERSVPQGYVHNT